MGNWIIIAATRFFDPVLRAVFLGLLLLAVGLLLLVRTRDSHQANLTAPAHRPSMVHIPVEDQTEAEKAEFERTFSDKIKPAVERWCKTYAGHTPFRAEDVTPDKLRERVSPGRPFQGYAFVINGTTLDVCDDHGSVYVDYLIAPASRQLMQIPSNPAPPVPPSISNDEILRLLKEDSGKDYPPDEVAIRPTSFSGGMNGGVFVDVGEGVHQKYYPLTDFSIVFGPDGNLVCYGRSVKP